MIVKIRDENKNKINIYKFRSDEKTLLKHTHKIDSKTFQKVRK